MNLQGRVLEEELMDSPTLPADLHHAALKGLRRVNQMSGTAGVMARAIQKAIPITHGEKIRILDLACGGGDVAILLAMKLSEAGYQAELVGWDRSPTAIDLANRAAREAGATQVHFEVHDVLEEDYGSSFDVLTCTLFLHHLHREESIRLLGKMYHAARKLVLIDDLRRTWMGLALAHVACRVLTRSPIVRVDGPMSVRAAYRESEIEPLAYAAGIPIPAIQRHWPQRFLLQWSR